MSNTITIELCAEDRVRLDQILTALERSTFSPNPMTALPEVKVEPKKEEPKPEPIPEPVTPAKPTIALADIQRLVQELAAPGSGKRDAVRQLVKAYADRVSLIPEDKWEEVHGLLVDIKGVQ